MEVATSAGFVTQRHGIDLIQELEHGFAARLIRSKARQLSQKSPFTRSDRDDIEQQLRIDLLDRFQHYDPERANWKSFLLAVIDRRVASLYKAARAQKRRHERDVVSLSTEVPGDEGVPTELAQTLLPRHQDFLVGSSLHEDQEAFALEHDVATVLAQLPTELRKLAELLKTQSVSQIARRLRLPRSTVVDQVARLAEHFKKHEMQNYLVGDP